MDHEVAELRRELEMMKQIQNTPKTQYFDIAKDPVTRKIGAETIATNTTSWIPTLPKPTAPQSSAVNNDSFESGSKTKASLQSGASGGNSVDPTGQNLLVVLTNLLSQDSEKQTKEHDSVPWENGPRVATDGTIGSIRCA